MSSKINLPQQDPKQITLDKVSISLLTSAIQTWILLLYLKNDAAEQ
jgi:hypothetical protein